MGDLEVNLKFPYRLAASILSVVSAYLGPAETGADPPCRENVDVAASFRVSTASPMLFVGLVSEEPDVADHPPLFGLLPHPPTGVHHFHGAINSAVVVVETVISNGITTRPVPGIILAVLTIPTIATAAIVTCRIWWLTQIHGAVGGRSGGLAYFSLDFGEEPQSRSSTGVEGLPLLFTARCSTNGFVP